MNEAELEKLKEKKNAAFVKYSAARIAYESVLEASLVSTRSACNNARANCDSSFVIYQSAREVYKAAYANLVAARIPSTEDKAAAKVMRENPLGREPPQADAQANLPTPEACYSNAYANYKVARAFYKTYRDIYDA
ncbi:MAG: hypothetical protein WCO51_13785, partial [bacterium]